MSEETEPDFAICCICGEKTTVPECCDICSEPHCSYCVEDAFVKCEMCNRKACRKCLEYDIDEGVFFCGSECKEEWLKLEM